MNIVQTIRENTAPTRKVLNSDGLLHYRACGLDNVFLNSGFKVSEDNAHYAIEDIDGLHRCIAMTIISQKRELTGQELKFLRKELSFTQTQIAKICGVDVQTVARWENSKTSNQLASRLLRVIYIGKMDKASLIYDLLESIGDLDIKEHYTWVMNKDKKQESWAGCLQAA